MIDKIQNSFSGGLIRPELWHRTDLPMVQAGLKTCENAIITDVGSWAMRPGTKYISATREESNIYPYLSSGGNQFYFEFQDDYMYIRNSDYEEYSLDAVLSDWDGLSHPENEWVRIGFNHEFTLSGQKLKIFSSYTYSRIITISIATNTSDTLLVEFVEPSTLSIKIANTTRSKNAISLIQAAIRAVGVQGIYHFEDVIVLGDVTWASPPITGSDSHTYTSMNTLNMRAIYSVEDAYTPIKIGHNLQGAYNHGQTGDALSSVKMVSNGENVYFTMQDAKPFTCTVNDRGAEYFTFNDTVIESGPYIKIEKTDFYFTGNVIDTAKTIADINSLSTVINSNVTSAQYIGSGLKDSYIKTFSMISSFEFHFYGSSAGTNDEWNVDFITNGTISWQYTDPGNGIIKLLYSKDGLSFTDTGVIINGNNAMYSLDEQCIYRLQWPLNTAGDMLFLVTTDAFIAEGIYTIGDYSSGTGKHALTCVKWGNPLYFRITDYPAPGGNTLFNQVSTESKVYISVFNEYFGYPRLVYFFQNRLGYASNTKFPYTRWESKVGEYLNFDLTFPVVNDGPVNSEIVIGENEIIHYIYEFESLLIFTSGSVWKFKLSDSGYGPLTPLLRKRVSKIGSADIEPINLNQTIYYVDSTLKSVQSININADSENYTVQDITLYFRDLIDGYTINDMKLTKNPFNILWLLRSDGKLLSISIVGTNYACSLHAIGDQVIDLQTNELNSYELSMNVLRGTDYLLEVLILDNLLNYDENGNFVRCDSHASFDLESSSLTFTGLDHLDGQSVSVLADGWPLTKTIAANTLTLTTAASKVIVGLPYTAKFEPIHQTYERKTGTGLATEQVIPRAKVRFIKSVGGYIGSSSASKVRVPSRQTNPTIPDSPFTGWQKFELEATYTDDQTLEASQMYFEQTSPLPAQISSIIMSIE